MTEVQKVRSGSLDIVPALAAEMACVTVRMAFVIEFQVGCRRRALVDVGQVHGRARTCRWPARRCSERLTCSERR